MSQDTVPLRPLNGWVRPPFALTSMPEKLNHYIKFRHPAYSSDTGNNVLLTLLACDHPEGGLHHETARIACGIVAGNAWNGYFAYSAGGEPIGLGPDGILREKQYYFHVPRPEGMASQSDVPTSPICKYPVYPTFRHWRFPHDNIPPSWPRPLGATSTDSCPLAPSSLASAVTYRDDTCRITNQRDAVQCAHLCPRGELSWFISNNMMVYNSNIHLPRDYAADDLNNAIALRSDLHTLFDRRIFAFVPKALKTDKTPRYVSHILQKNSETGPLYHNAFIYPVDVPREFLFARFAWAIFPSLESFLILGSERLLLINQGGSGVPKKFSANECFELAGTSRSVSRSHSVSQERKAGSTPQGSDVDADSREGTPQSQHKRQRLSPTESSPSSSDNQQQFQLLEERGRQIQRTMDWAMSGVDDLGGGEN